MDEARGYCGVVVVVVEDGDDAVDAEAVSWTQGEGFGGGRGEDFVECFEDRGGGGTVCEALGTGEAVEFVPGCFELGFADGEGVDEGCFRGLLRGCVGGVGAVEGDVFEEEGLGVVDCGD